MADAFGKTTLRYRTLAPEHIAFATLTAGAAGPSLPIADATIRPAHSYLFSIHWIPS